MLQCFSIERINIMRFSCSRNHCVNGKHKFTFTLSTGQAHISIRTDKHSLIHTNNVMTRIHSTYQIKYNNMKKNVARYKQTTNAKDRTTIAY